jgi:hypothetical protein
VPVQVQAPDRFVSKLELTKNRGRVIATFESLAAVLGTLALLKALDAQPVGYKMPLASLRPLPFHRRHGAYLSQRCVRYGSLKHSCAPLSRLGDELHTHNLPGLQRACS